MLYTAEQAVKLHETEVNEYEKRINARVDKMLQIVMTAIKNAGTKRSLNLKELCKANNFPSAENIGYDWYNPGRVIKFGECENNDLHDALYKRLKDLGYSIDIYHSGGSEWPTTHEILEW
jgi:hypothetical protein